MQSPEERLQSMGIQLPTPAPPIASYVPSVRIGDTLHVSGQLSLGVGDEVKGIVGVDVTLEEGRRAARLCGINLLAQFRAALGDLSKVERVLKLGVYVQAGPEFYDIPQVANGCSDLLVEVFGDAGRHARSAVGVYRLPLGVAVEVDAVIIAR